MAKTLGLALGSGGARGWAHIGVIRTLEQAGIKVDFISGSSIGALVGAIHAAGALHELEAFIRDLQWQDILSFFDMVFPRSGLLDGNKIYALLSDHIRSMAIEAAPIPFRCVATDLLRGEEVCLTSGSMVDAVRASISIPGVFTPVPWNGTHLADGGIVNPVPVDVVRAMGAEVVLAVNLNGRSPVAVAEIGVDESVIPVLPATEGTGVIAQFRGQYKALTETLQSKLEQWLPQADQAPTIFETIGITLNLMEQQITQSRLADCPPDLLVEPPLQEFGIFDFHRAAEIIRVGERHGRLILPELQSRLMDE
ncbi:MAG: patatin family protein [Oscillatoriales cyanobacterium SM2_2_1]|nr:patatin family protein [Oscillatoriales cyanobacterium SM2_2_1]